MAAQGAFSTEPHSLPCFWLLACLLLYFSSMGLLPQPTTNGFHLPGWNMTWPGHRWPKLGLLELFPREVGYILLLAVCIAPIWPSLALKGGDKCHQGLQREDALTDSFSPSFHPPTPTSGARLNQRRRLCTPSWVPRDWGRGIRTGTNVHRGRSPLRSQPYARGTGRERASRLPPSFALRQ